MRTVRLTVGLCVCEDEMMKHTIEPWSYHKTNGSPTTGMHMIAGGKPGYLAEVRDCGSGDVEQNARRIVACVNACEGVTTEELEQGGFVPGLFERIERLAEAMRDFIDYGYSRERALYELKMVDALTRTVSKPDCDRSVCGDFSLGPCDNPDCTAIKAKEQK